MSLFSAIKSKRRPISSSIKHHLLKYLRLEAISIMIAITFVIQSIID